MADSDFSDANLGAEKKITETSKKLRVGSELLAS